MGNLNETEKWEENIYQLETSDPVLGGADGISNRAPRQLANRTKWLKKKTEEAAQSLAEHVRSRNHPDATLTAKGFTQLSSATNSTSETLAATPKAVKAAYDLAAGKAPVSHTHPWSQITGVPAASLTAKGTVQLSSAINSTSEILAATPKAVKAAYDLANGKQPADATLTALAGLATAADRLPYFTGADRAALATLTAIGRAIIAKGSIKDVLNYLGLGEGSALPVGVPVPWPTATPPAGWLQCDGRAFTKEQYPVLARVYPTLRLPDLRGEFIRGWD
ncbi:phage tail protein, partial [Parasutterella excrementihominis]|nr:phage tail protein [Parasutterella excrementihominis]